MRKTLLAAAAAVAALGFARCATKQVEAKSEVIYEDADGGEIAGEPAPLDPFRNCKAAPAQYGASFNCDSVSGAFLQLRGVMNEQQIEQTLQNEVAPRFPKEATQERFTETYGEWTGQGLRVFEESPVAPFYSQTVIVPIPAGATRIVSCTQGGTTNRDRCNQVVAELVRNGIPEKVEGAPPPPTLPTPGEEDGGLMVGDGGMMMGDGGLLMIGDGGAMGDGGTMGDGGMRTGPDGGTGRRTR